MPSSKPSRQTTDSPAKLCLSLLGSLPEEAGTETAERLLRKTEAYRSVARFALTYLAHHFTDADTGELVPFGPHHEELFAAVEDPADNKHLLRAEPREHGKSTVMDLAVALWWLATQRKRFVVLVADTSSQAEGHLHSVIEEIEDNELLLADYPHLAPALDHRKQLVKWTDREIINQAGQIVVAVGSGKSLRGLKRRQWRPDAVVIDDLENDENVATKGQRDKLERWFKAALLSLGARGCDYFYVGTILHHDSLMMRLVKAERAAKATGQPPMWDVLVIPAEMAERKDVYEGVPAEWYERGTLWPEHWPPERLAAKRALVGSIVYAQEYLNDPSQREGKLFKEVWAKWYTLGGRPSQLDEYMGIDPSASIKEQGDHIGIATVGADSEGRLFIGRVIETNLSFRKFIDAIFALAEHIRPAKIGVESVFYQNVLHQELVRINREERRYLPFAEQRTIKDKVTRFLSLSVLMENGYLWFEENNPEHEQLLNQMLEFPDGAHDDLIDALDFAVTASRRKPGKVTDGEQRAKPVAAGLRSTEF